MLNKCVLIGRIVFNLEIKRTGSDVAIINNVLAVDRAKKGREKVVDFIPFTAWNKSAEYLYNYAEKGSLVALTGSVRIDTFSGEDGNNKKKFYVNAETIKIISGKFSSRQPSDEPKIQIEEDLPF